MTTRLANAQIRYTTDGSAPSNESPLYAGASLEFSVTTRLMAQAFLAGEPQGEPSGALYVARGIDSTHDLPVVILDDYAAGRPSARDRSFVPTAFLGFAPADGTTSLAATPAVANFAAFHTHGQSSVMFGKPSYRIELRDDAGADRNCALFGMPAEADWVLIGPYADKTLVHNPLVYSLGRDLGLATPRIAQVELFLNVDDQPLTSIDYMGVYQVVEKIKIQKDRMNLAKLLPTDVTEPDISGGYIFKFEWLATEPPVIPCPGGGDTCWSDMELVEPEAPNAQQLEYLTQHLKAFNDVLHSASPADPVSGYPAFIDVQSFVDHIIVNELTRNLDAYVRSQYFHMERGRKIVAGPLWDFDLIAGVGMGQDPFIQSFPNLDTAGWQYESNAARMTSDWFEILLAEPSFKAQLAARWVTLRQGLLSDVSLGARIDSLTAGLANAANRNFMRWPILAQETVMPFTTPIAPTWQGQVEVMRNWLVQRAAWLDTQWN